MIAVIFWILISLSAATGAMMLMTIYGSVLLIGIYTSLVVMAQIFASKLVLFGPWVVPAAVIVYAISFLVTDALSEFYSKEEALKAVVCGFIGSILLVLGIQIVIVWPAPTFWGNQEALIAVLGSTWRIVLGSLTSYIFSQNWDVFAFHFIRNKTNGKHLWLRNNLSTMTSQFIDTIIFITIAFWGTVPSGVVLNMIIGQYIVKLIIAALDTPFLYILKFWFGKRREVKSA